MSRPEPHVRILVVDDLPEKLLVLRAALEDLGEEVVTAGSGAEALRQVLRHDFAVILLDVNMPGLDGFETAALIRQRRRSKHVPIIFVTAFSDELHHVQGYSLGAVDYLLAPVVPEILRAKVRVFVQLFRMTQQVKHQAEERVALEREQTLRAVAEEATRRSSFLAEASAALMRTLELDELARALARIAVPTLGDESAVWLLDEQGRTVLREYVRVVDAAVGGSGVVPARAATEELARAMERAMATGGCVTLPALDGGLARGAPAGAPPGPGLVLPFVGRNRALGALALRRAPGSPPYEAGTIALAESVAVRAALAIDNATLYAQIQQVDRRKNEFLAMLAHELRNPLAPIVNAIDVLQRIEPPEPVVRQQRDIIQRQAQQMRRLLDDLLDVSRITRGKIELRQEWCDVADIVARAVEAASPLVQARAHRLDLTLPTRPVRLLVDPARLAQIVTNLLNNAATYTDSGGRIELIVETSGADVVLRVRDNGIGMTAETLERAFDLFAQADRALERQHGGLGVGLTLVQRLVELHGGTVQALSEGLGRGSELVVRLPMGAAVDRPAAPLVQPGRPAASVPPCRLLIVDDNVDAAEGLALLFRLQGHEACTAHSGLEALQKARVLRPEVVLLDIGLPGMDGFEVARQLKCMPEAASALFVAVSGYGRDHDRIRSREAAFHHHLTKPVDFDVLRALIGTSTGTGPARTPS